ncbi:MAG: type IV pilus biogenesis/stability protein PilW [Burkholderiaceae bacterium]|nr:type IV pilus biogenesis/stability protein PilW [Burkholderiaceae bacterium]
MDRIVFTMSLVLAALIAGCAAPAPGEAPASGAQFTPLPDSSEESEDRRRARIRLELAATYYQQGNYAVALHELRQALALEPNYPQALGMLGLVSMDLGDNARAEESFQRALRLAPGDSEINNNYGWFLCNTGREKQSIEHFQRALLNPLYTTPSRPLHNAGICSLRVGDEAAAEAYFLRAFQFDPRNPVAMFNLSEIYLKRRDAERARFYSQRLLAAYDPTAQVLWLALRVERLAGNRDGEASLAAQLRRRYPASSEAARLSRGEFGD